MQAPHFRKSQLTIQSEAEGTVKTVWGSYAPPPDVPSRSAPPSVGPEHGQGEQQRHQRHLAVVVADRRRRDRQIIGRIDSIHLSDSSLIARPEHVRPRVPDCDSSDGTEQAAKWCTQRKKGPRGSRPSQSHE